MRSFLFGLGFVLISVASLAQQVAKSMTSGSGLFVGFYEFKPPTYDADQTKKFPLIIFLHGIGERGNGTTELSRVTANGIPSNIKWGSKMTYTVNGTAESFLVLSPQLAANYGGWVNGYVDAMLEYASKNLRYDPDRVYLTGLSAGGGGTWDYVSSKAGNSGIFAAIAPVCGSSYTASGMCYIAKSHLPVWAFHAMDDGTVPVSTTQNAVKMINACSPAPNPAPKVTYYPAGKGGHGIWYMSYDETHTYANPNLYEWFLSKRKSTNGNGLNQEPVVQLNSDVSLVLPANSTTLDGSASYDFDGSIASYNWSKVAGPDGYTIVSPTAAKTTVSNLVEGSYVFQLKITDDKGTSSTAQVKVLVQTAYGADKAPIALAGNDFTSTNSTVYLSGAGSYDPDGKIASFKWFQLSGPSTATIIDGTTPFPTISKLISGTYQFRLLVTDNLGKPDDDTVSFSISTGSVVNAPPVAKTSGNITITLPVNTATLDGSGSTDSDGSITKYEWSQTAGPGTSAIVSPTGKTTVVNNLIAGTYTYQLKVTDNLLATATTTVTITVQSSTGTNKPPIALAGNDFTSVNSTVYLSGAGSYDLDGKIASFQWTQVSGPVTASVLGATTAFPTVSKLIPGTYKFRLLITDNLGATAEDEVSFNISSGSVVNTPPVAIAGSNVTITQPVSSATLDGSGSTDSDGSISKYEWSQTAGPSASTIVSPLGATTVVSNLVPGSYSYQLKVTDNLNGTATATATVAVNPSNNKLPIANAGNDFSTTNNYAYLSAGASYDTDGKIAAFSWSQVSGPNTAGILASTGMFPTVQSLIAGSYTFRVKVTDNSGGAATDDVVLTVTAKTATAGSVSTQSKAVTNDEAAKAFEAKELSLYPNPASNQVIVSYANSFVGNYKIVIYDVKGKVEAQYSFTKPAAGAVQKQLDISKLPAGMHYIQTVYDGNLKSTVRKFIKR